MNQVAPVLAGRHAALLAAQHAFNRVAQGPDCNPLLALQCLVECATAVIPAAALIGIALPRDGGMLTQAASVAGFSGLRLELADIEHPLRIDDAQAQAHGSHGMAEQLAMRSFVLIPLHRPDGKGVLYFAGRDAACFDDADLLLGQLLGGILSTAPSFHQDLAFHHALAGRTGPLESCADRVELIGQDGTVTWINPAARRLLGDAVGAAWPDLWPRTCRAAAASAISAARAGGVGRFRGPGKAGEWWDVTLTAIAPDAGGSLLALGRNISDLRESAERTSLALEAGSVMGIGVWEAGGLSLDERLFRVFGLKAPATGTLRAADFLRRVHPDDRVVLRALSRRIRANSEDLTASFRLRAPPAYGAPAVWRWVEARGVVANGDDGRFRRLTGVLIDIDARKRVELELAQNEQTVRQIADSLPVLLVYVAPDMTFRFANRAYRSAFRDASGIKTGDAVVSLFAEAVEDGPGGLLQRCLAGERIRFDSQNRDRDGVLRDLDVEYIPRRGGGGEFDGCYVIGIDITARKEEERALSRSNLTLEQSLAVAQEESERVWRLSRDLLCVRDRQWRLRSVNPAWSTVLGWSAEALLGGDCLDLIHPDDRSNTILGRRTHHGGVEAGGFENRYRTRDGNYRWLSWSVVTADGLIYATARDITAEKAASLRVQRVEEQLRQAQKMEAVGQLTGGIAHDFNNLLTGVIGSLEMMRNRMQQGRLDGLGKYMDAAAGAAERAASVTHRLLSFSRRQTLEPKLILADRLIEEMDELIRRAAGPVAALQIVRHRGAWSILCDPRQLEIALLNLVNNARDAMPEGGRLVIETANAVLEAFELDGVIPAGEYVALSVTDTGIGMSADVATRAFDPFFTTKPIGRGTGLGLSMVYGFARQSGGHARIVSTPGHGARVTIYLPRAMENSLAPAGRSGRAVLLVEDEPMVRMLVGEVLGELDCDTIEAVDGAGGLRVLEGDRPIDLLITDIGLPGGINGMQMAEAARRSRPDLKVLFITGLPESSVLEAGAQLQAMEVIGKPFTIELLMERVRAMMPS